MLASKFELSGRVVCMPNGMCVVCQKNCPAEQQLQQQLLSIQLRQQLQNSSRRKLQRRKSRKHVACRSPRLTAVTTTTQFPQSLLCTSPTQLWGLGMNFGSNQIPSQFGNDWEEDEEPIRSQLLQEKARTLPQVDLRDLQQDTTEPEPEPHDESTNKKGVAVPVCVMLPLDVITTLEDSETKIKREKWLDVGLFTLREAGVQGIMVDVWWGIVEREGPRKYNFSAYRRLFHKAAALGLQVQTVMSFHAAGGNVGDTCVISLPPWVLKCGEKNPDIFYTDRSGYRNKEYLTLGVDHQPVLEGRTAIQCYKDFISAFCDNFSYLFGNVMSEITIGLGPAGELRYPSYPEGDGRWRFPGVGEFQCYDKYMLQDLQRSAQEYGHPEWGLTGPHDAGSYCCKPWETGFFNCQEGSWETPYGHFLLSWYSRLLIRHADDVFTAACAVLNAEGRPRVLFHAYRDHEGSLVYEFKSSIQVGGKLPGVHWWYNSRSHAAELTAGFYNVFGRNGYEPVVDIFKKHNASLSFTCVEMRDNEHPQGLCSPQGLMYQVTQTAKRKGVGLTGENALQRYDGMAFDRMVETAKALDGGLQQLTFLRMGDLMFDNWSAFCRFVERMRHGLHAD